jgi:hypothetical protein
MGVDMTRCRRPALQVSPMCDVIRPQVIIARSCGYFESDGFSAGCLRSPFDGVENGEMQEYRRRFWGQDRGNSNVSHRYSTQNIAEGISLLVTVSHELSSFTTLLHGKQSPQVGAENHGVGGLTGLMPSIIL